MCVHVLALPSGLCQVSHNGFLMAWKPLHATINVGPRGRLILMETYLEATHRSLLPSAAELQLSFVQLKCSKPDS